MDGLARTTIAGFSELVAALGILLFAPAWTLRFWQAWVYLFVFSASCALITAYLWTHDRALLERRVEAGPGAEKERLQARIQVLASAAFIALLAVPSIDRRFAWSHVSPIVVLAGDVLVAIGFALVFLVFRENTFSGATIAVSAGQRVVATGPYSVVRHPMYAGALVMLFGTPLALGSWWGLLAMIPMTLAIVWRLLDEERFLAKNLGGYDAYRALVRYRLVPLVW